MIYSERYAKEIHKPAKKAEEGDIGFMWAGDQSIYSSQCCLVGVDSPMGGFMIHLFDRLGTEISSVKRRVLSIEPTLKTKAETDYLLLAEKYSDVIKRAFKNR